MVFLNHVMNMQSVTLGRVVGIINWCRVANGTLTVDVQMTEDVCEALDRDS